MSLRKILAVTLMSVSVVAMAQTTPKSAAVKAAVVTPPKLIDVTVHEGTSMSVAVSPDGQTLAMDMQGSIYTLPATGGPAKRITDLFDDARQPVWSPDGQWITCFAYLEGG